MKSISVLVFVIGGILIANELVVMISTLINGKTPVSALLADWGYLSGAGFIVGIMMIFVGGALSAGKR